MSKKDNKIVQLNLIERSAVNKSTQEKVPLKPKPASTSQISYSIVLKVKLFHDKRTYRLIEIGSSNSLDTLHEIIFEAFDRFDEHLYSFFFPEEAVKRTSAIRDSLEYISPDYKIEPLFEHKTKYNAKKTALKDLKLCEKQKFYYLFDYGDEWWHEIEVYTLSPGAPGPRSPQILKSVGKSPSQYPDNDEDDD